jgi:hypothetical protein
MRFVLDASVTLSWLLRDTAPRDEAYPLAVLNALRDPDTVAMVPTTWGLGRVAIRLIYICACNLACPRCVVTHRMRATGLVP